MQYAMRSTRIRNESHVRTLTLPPQNGPDNNGDSLANLHTCTEHAREAPFAGIRQGKEGGGGIVDAASPIFLE